IRPSDTLARFGGDEFVLLCEDVGDRTGAEAVARRVSDAVLTPFSIRGHEVRIGLSTGIALADGEADPDTLLREADAAMYRAKRRGRNRYEVVDVGARADDVAREESLRDVVAAAA